MEFSFCLWRKSVYVVVKINVFITYVGLHCPSCILIMFNEEYKALRKILGPNRERERLTAGFRKLYNDGLHCLHSSFLTVSWEACARTVLRNV
jgi:hypothetical protein